MPLILYVCECKESYKKYFKSAKDATPTVKCKCGAEAVKSLGSTTSNHLVTIDNGLMARRLEISPDIMEINDERSAKDYSEDD